MHYILPFHIFYPDVFYFSAHLFNNFVKIDLFLIVSRFNFINLSNDCILFRINILINIEKKFVNKFNSFIHLFLIYFADI